MGLFKFLKPNNSSQTPEEDTQMKVSKKSEAKTALDSKYLDDLENLLGEEVNKFDSEREDFRKKLIFDWVNDVDGMKKRFSVKFLQDYLYKNKFLESNLGELYPRRDYYLTKQYLNMGKPDNIREQVGKAKYLREFLTHFTLNQILEPKLGSNKASESGVTELDGDELQKAYEKGELDDGDCYLGNIQKESNGRLPDLTLKVNLSHSAKIFDNLDKKEPFSTGDKANVQGKDSGLFWKVGFKYMEHLLRDLGSLAENPNLLMTIWKNLNLLDDEVGVLNLMYDRINYKSIQMKENGAVLDENSQLEEFSKDEDGLLFNLNYKLEGINKLCNYLDEETIFKLKFMINRLMFGAHLYVDKEYVKAFQSSETEYLLEELDVTKLLSNFKPSFKEQEFFTKNKALLAWGKSVYASMTLVNEASLEPYYCKELFENVPVELDTSDSFEDFENSYIVDSLTRHSIELEAQVEVVKQFITNSNTYLTGNEEKLMSLLKSWVDKDFNFLFKNEINEFKKQISLNKDKLSDAFGDSTAGDKIAKMALNISE